MSGTPARWKNILWNKSRFKKHTLTSTFQQFTKSLYTTLYASDQAKLLPLRKMQYYMTGQHSRNSDVNKRSKKSLENLPLPQYTFHHIAIVSSVWKRKGHLVKWSTYNLSIWQQSVRSITCILVQRWPLSLILWSKSHSFPNTLTTYEGQ